MRLQVTQLEIDGAGRQPEDNPITRAMRHSTGAPWCLINNCLILQLASHYWQLELPKSVRLNWQIHRCLGIMQPFTCTVDLESSLLATRRKGERREGERREGEQLSDGEHNSDRRRLDRRLNERRWPHRAINSTIESAPR